MNISRWIPMQKANPKLKGKARLDAERGTNSRQINLERGTSTACVISRQKLLTHGHIRQTMHWKGNEWAIYTILPFFYPVLLKPLFTGIACHSLQNNGRKQLQKESVIKVPPSLKQMREYVTGKYAFTWNFSSWNSQCSEWPFITLCDTITYQWCFASEPNFPDLLLEL